MSERLSSVAMNRLSPIEWALVKGPIAHLSLPPGNAAQRARMTDWLERRPGAGWFYVSGDNYHFGAASDAADFRRMAVSVEA